nr:hypothetical protein [uncultured archaeon]
MKISDLGEIGLIERIRKNTKLFSNGIIKGIGDDAAVIKFDKKYYMLLTTDTMMQDDHFKLGWFNSEQIGKKAIESNVSDIAAMGGFPKYALTSIIMPKTTSVDFIDGLYDGLNKAAKKYKISIIGGNLSSGDKISITLTIVGFVEKKNLCLRSNAKVNDLILVTGNLGSSRAGLELFRSNKSGSSINYYLNPASKLNIARQLIKYGINAMEDVSDGLASEIINICSESKTGAVIYKEKIPLSRTTINDAKKVGKDAYDYALFGGEDYELVCTINKNKFKNLEKINKKIKFKIVGKILPRKQGVYLLDKGNKKKLSYGYEHFKNN